MSKPGFYINSLKKLDKIKIVERDTGAGDRENRGLEGFWRQEEKGREGFPKVAGMGRKEEKIAILHNFTIEIEQRGDNPYKRGWEAGVKGMRGGSFRSPRCLPPQDSH